MLKIALYQMDSVTLDIQGNTDKIIAFYNQYHNNDLIITPEMSVLGYGSYDYIWYEEIRVQLQLAIKRILKVTRGKKAKILVGAPEYKGSDIYNSTMLLGEGICEKTIYKHVLPNDAVFNEGRYFKSADKFDNIIGICGCKVGVLICADTWDHQLLEKLVKFQPDLIVSVNSSPFYLDRMLNRYDMVEYLAKKNNCPCIYLNQVGAIDSLVFEGSSLIIDNKGVILHELKKFDEDYAAITYQNHSFQVGKVVPEKEVWDKNEVIYRAIFKSFSAFFYQNKFNKLIIGLSGGIDSTLAAALAADIIGASNILGVFMPSSYTSEDSYNVVRDFGDVSDIEIITIPIDKLLMQYEETLPKSLELTNLVKGNIQSRIRGTVLMSVANTFSGGVVLSNGNKTEIAIGYYTLYGDSCGGFNLLKGLYKRDVYELAKWRNSNFLAQSLVKKKNIIPQLVIDRKPTAELADNQFDEDDLMNYELLDDILYNIVELKESYKVLGGRFGFDNVAKVYCLINKSHYKRYQTPLGPRIYDRDLFNDFRYPLSLQLDMQKFKEVGDNDDKG